MKNKTAIIVLIVLVVLIALVLYLRYNAQQKRASLQQQQQLAEMQLAQQFLSYQQNQQLIEAQQTTTLKDWLNTIGSISGIFSGIDLGGMFGGDSRTSGGTKDYMYVDGSVPN